MTELYQGSDPFETAKGRDVYCHFDNDQVAHAPRDALRHEDAVVVSRCEASWLIAR